MLSGKRIVLGVTGGIAAYKAAFLLREFQKAGAEVRVTMTPSATRFVGLETFASLSGSDVAVEIFPEEHSGGEWTRHIYWGEWADLFVIAPCTANTLGKIAGGISDNMLCSTVLAARCPVLICPTMDGEMYESPGVAGNLDKVREMGYHLLDPASGYLASGLEGKGRLPEFDDILTKASDIIGDTEGPLKGKKVVVTAGPTREHLDPVRFISNPSTGKMGIAMAKAAAALGGEVVLIHGPLSVPVPEGIQTTAIESAAEMFEAVKEQAGADVIIMAAAVADYTPAETSEQKIKKSDGPDSITLKRTADILQWLGEHKRESQTLIGFAMETENLLANARSKMKGKNADYIIANSLSEEGAGFASDTNSIHLISASGDKDAELQETKENLAFQVLNLIFR